MLLGTLALFVVSLGYGVIVPLLPELAGGREATDEGLVSAVYASYAVCKIGLQVPGGVWADRLGPLRILRVALVLFVLSLAGFLLPVGLEAFTVLRALEGGATGLVYPALFALAASGDPAKTGKRMGLMAGLGTSGLLVGPALGGLLAHHGPRVPVAVALGLAVLVTLAFFVAPRPALPDREPRTVRQEVRGLVRLGTTLGFVGLMLPIAFNKLTFSSFQGLLPLVGPDFLGLGVPGVTGLFILTGLAFALTQPVGGFLADRFAARSVALVLSVPLLLSLVAQWLAPDATAFAIGYGVYIGLSSMIFTATMKHAAVVFGTDDTYGGVFGLLGTLTDLMTVVGPLLFLNLYPALGMAIFALMAGIGLLFLVGFVALRPTEARAGPPGSASA